MVKDKLKNTTVSNDSNDQKSELSQDEIARREVLRNQESLNDQERLELTKLDERMEAHKDSRTVRPVSGRVVEDAQDEADEEAGNGRTTGAE
jgi:hypothetical protein